MPLSVLVVGAGIGGLATAIALRQAGHKVVVLEKSKVKREVGFAVTVPPNASRVLRELGVDFGKARMTEWRGIDQFKADVDDLNWEPGPYMDAEKIWGSPHLVAHRVDLHEALWEKAVGDGKGVPVDIRGGIIVKSFDVAGSVTLDTGETMGADIVVAADGIGSKAHVAVIDEERPARKTKVINLRFTVPTATLLANPKTSDLISRGDHRAGVYFDTSNNYGLYRSPCRENTLQNFAIFYISEHLANSNGEQNVKASSEMALDLLGHFNETFKEICRLTDEQDMYFWHLADREPLPSFQRNRLVLVGDACHPMQPHFGQGASQAIEDAIVLGIVLENIDSPEQVPTQLKLWESLRRDRASAVQMLSRSDGMSYVLTEDTVKRVREHVSEDELPELSRFGAFNWMHGYNCITEARKVVPHMSQTNGVH